MAATLRSPEVNGYLARPDDRDVDGLHDAATVAQEHDVWSEEVEQALHITRLGGQLERFQCSAALRRGNYTARAPCCDVCPSPMCNLPDRGLTLVNRFGDLVIVEVEYVMQHEHRPLSRSERLE